MSARRWVWTTSLVLLLVFALSACAKKVPPPAPPPRPPPTAPREIVGLRMTVRAEHHEILEAVVQTVAVRMM